jgi:hypothetical protein
VLYDPLGAVMGSEYPVPQPTGPSEEDVARAIREVWENEFNHLIGTPLFKATVQAAYMALLRREPKE